MISRQSRDTDFQFKADDTRVLLKVGALSTLALLAVAAGIVFPENSLLLLLCAAFIAMFTATVFLAGHLGAELAGINGGSDDPDPALVRDRIPSSRSYDRSFEE